MEKVHLDDINHVGHPAEITTIRRPVSQAINTSGVAVTHLILEPGDAFSGALHTHLDQEEVFVVLEGTATFEVGRDRRTITVSAGEAIRFAPGEFQHGYNDSSSVVEALAIGAPGSVHDWEQNIVVIECRTCDEETLHDMTALGEDSWQAQRVDLRMTCSECNTSFTTMDIRNG